MRITPRSCRIVVVLALSGGLSGVCPPMALGQPQVPSSVRLNRASRAVAQVIARDEAGRVTAEGMGVFTDVGRLLIDSRLLHRASDVTIAGGRQARVTAVVAEDADAGLVLLAVDLPDGAPPALRPASSMRPLPAVQAFLVPADGVPVAVNVGTPRDIPGLGVVAALTGVEQAPSGVPVVDAEGAILGVVMTREGSQGAVAMLVPSRRLAQLPAIVPQRVADWSARSRSGSRAANQRRFVDGVAAALNGAHDAAAEGFAAAAADDAAGIEALRALGRTEWALRRVDGAAAAYRQALARQPSHVGVRRELSTLLIESGRTEEAHVHLSEVVRLRPEDAESRFALGYALGQLGRHEEEYEAYRAAVVLDAGHFKSLKNLAVVCLGLKRYEESLEASGRALRLAPSDAEVLTNIGAVYFDLGDYPKATESFRKALTYRPDFALARFALGATHLALHDRESAVAEGQALKPLDAARSAQLLRLAAALPERGQRK